MKKIEKTETNNTIQDMKALIDELRSQNETLKSQLMNTSLIHELTKVLHSCTDLADIEKTILLAIQEMVAFDRVMFFELNKSRFCLQTKSWVGINQDNIKKLTIPLGFEGGEITDAVFLNRHIIVEEPDKQNDPFYELLGSSTYLVVPVISKANRKCWELKSCAKTTCPAHKGFNPYCWGILGAGQLLNAVTENKKREGCLHCPCFKADGVFWMDRFDNRKALSSDDITMVTAITNLASIVIENYRIFSALDEANSDLQQANNKLKIVNHDLEIAQNKINNDLERAHTIQQGLLPQDISETGLALGARYLSAEAVGGDYYDIFQISSGIFGIVVADVSGHGIASALIMSMVKILLKLYATHEFSPQKTLEKINETFLSEIKTENYVTIFYAVLDTNSHTLRYSSAGHTPVLFLDKRTNVCMQVKADGLFLGVFSDMMLSETSRQYAPDIERLVLYTDGLVEAKGTGDAMYGLERLKEIVKETQTLGTQATVDAIMEDQKSFCGIDPLEDDVTLLVVDL